MAPWVEAQTRRLPRSSHSRDLPHWYRYQIELGCDNHWPFFSTVATTNHTPFRVAVRDGPSKKRRTLCLPTHRQFHTHLHHHQLHWVQSNTNTNNTKISTPPNTQDLFSLIALLHLLYSFVQPILPTTPVTISTSPLTESLVPQLQRLGRFRHSLPFDIRFSLHATMVL